MTAPYADTWEDEPKPAPPSNTPLLDAALHYAEHGIHVFPAIIRKNEEGKKDINPVGPWRQMSTTDPMRISMWFGPNGMYHSAALCIDTGKSGLVGVDSDGELGNTNWAAFRAKHGLGATWIAHTPGGGQHWYYRADPERPVKNTTGDPNKPNANYVAVKVDTRGAGGFLIAPPTRDYRGAYRWGAEGEPEWPELPVVPVPVVDAVNGKHVGRPSKPPKPARSDGHTPSPPSKDELRQALADSGLDGFVSDGDLDRATGARRFTQEQAIGFCKPHMARLRAAKEGTRNDSLNIAAKVLSHFVPEFWSREQAESYLCKALDPAYPQDEAARTIESAFGSAAGDWVAEKAEPPAQQAGDSDGPTRETGETEQDCGHSGPEVTCDSAADLWNIAIGPDLPAPKRAKTQYYQAPLECLPPLLGQFVDTVSEAVQVPPEMALMAALTSVSFVTGGKLVVAINTHFEPLTLWALVTAAPSERKSAALTAAARGPLKAAVAQYWEDHEEEQTKLADKVEITEARIKGYKHAVATAREDEDREEAQDNLDTARENLKDLLEQVIHRPLWAITDATPEGLEESMAATGGPVASFNDEAALLSTIAGRYSRGAANTASLNQAHSQGNIHVIRKGSTRVVDEPHLVLCQIIQPEPFAQLMGALRVKADGFLSRWLYADPAPYGSRMARGGDIDTSVINQWTKTLRMLLDRCWAQKNVTSMHLTEESWAVYEEMFNQIDADVQAHSLTDGTYSQWLGKAANAHMVRIAAMFELVGDPSSETISGDSMRRAATLYGWLRDEAHKAMTTTSGDEIQPETERKALEYIAGQRAKDRAANREPMELVTARDFKRGPRAFRVMEPAEIEAALMQLEAGGWLSRTDSAGRTDAQTRWRVRWDFEAVWKP